VIIVRAIACAEGPLRRTTPMPPRPGGVAIATIVSLVENMPQAQEDHKVFIGFVGFVLLFP
jgi:hypothetical protein